MARPIDEKIVAMKMDNSDFKRKAIETTGLFGKLKDSLNKIPGVNLGGVTKQLTGIQRAANSTDLSTLGRSLDSIQSKFSALNVMATTALVNITNRAVNAGLALGRSLGPDQMADGFREYEMKMGSIGTMLSNTEWNGSDLEDVKKTLGELNDYADDTIYSFGQMTQNIGRFTAAGITLEDSATAIKGLGNLAAVSGSNTDQLNTAMYQMSQALSSGKLNLMDWNSLINAGMGGKKTQDALLATAKAMGVNVDMSEGFRNSIEQGWLTSEVLLQTLKQFGEDDSMTKAATSVRTFTGMMSSLREGIGSGWSETFELIFGDFEEATLLWTTISNVLKGVFDKQSKARNDFLRSIIDGDGKVLENMFATIKNIGEPIIQVFKAIGDGFKIAFPPMGISGLEKIVAGFKNLTSGMAFSSKTVENIKLIFAGFFSVFAIGWKLVSGAVSIILALIPSFSGLGSKILELISRVAQIPIAFNNAADSGESFGSGMSLLKKMASGVSNVLESIVNGALLFTDAISMAWNILAKGDFSGGPWEEDSKIVDWLFKIREGFQSLSDALGSIKLSSISDGFSNFFGSLKGGFDWLVDTAAGIRDSVKNMIPTSGELMSGGFIAGLVTIVGVAIKLSYDLMQVFTGWGKIGQGVVDVLDGVGSALEAFAFQVKAQAILTIAIAVGVLAASFWAISKLSWDDLSRGLYAIVGGLTAIVTAMGIMDKYDISGTGMSAAVQLIALSIAFSILAGAFNKMKDIQWDELGKGIVGLIGIMGTLSLSMIAMSKFSGPKVAASSLQFIALATAVHILVSAVKKIAEIEPEVLKKGLKYLGIILLELGLFLAIAGKATFGVGAALGAMGVATAIVIMVGAIRSMGEMDVNVLNQGLTTIGYILLAITAFAAITGTTGLFAASVGLVLVAGALTALTVPIAILGNMDMLTLAKGLGAMGIALVIIGGASMLMTGMIASGAGLILMATALNMLIVPIVTLGNMDMATLAIGIGAMAIAILAIGGAAIVIGLGAPALLLGALGIAAIGVAMLAAGAGMSLFGAGLVSLAGLTGAAVVTIVAMLGTLIGGLVSLIPAFVNFMSELTIKTLDALNKHAPVILNKLYDLAIKMLNVFEERVPQFAKAATDLIVAFLNSMSEQLPRVVEAASNLMVATVEALATAVETNGPKFTDAFKRLMGAIALIMIDAGTTTIKALWGWIPGVNAAADAIGESAENHIRETFNAESAGNDKGDDFNSALGSKKGGAQDAGATLAEGARTGADSIDLTSTGENAGLGFAQGIGSKNVLDRVISAGAAIANAVPGVIARVLDMHSPARVTDEQGQHTGQGFANGVGKKKKEVEKKANSLAGMIMNALGIKAPVQKESAKGGKAAGESFTKGVNSTKAKVSTAGKNIGSGFSKGISKGVSKGISKETTSIKKSAADLAKEAADKAKQAFDNAMANIRYKVDMGWINTDQEIKQITNLKKAYSKYPEIVKDVNLQLKRLHEKSTQERFGDEKEYIDDRKYYNKLSLTQELQAWQAIQKKYKAGTEERKEADREVYRLKNELIKKGFEDEKKAIDDRRYYNDLSLTEEIEAWTRIQGRYKKGTEERKEADRELYRLKNELNTKLIEINEDYTSKISEANKKLAEDEKQLTLDRDQQIKDTIDYRISEERRLTEEYENELDSRTNSLTNFVGIFERVSRKRYSGKQLLDNLKGQFQALTRWTEDFKKLSGRGLDEELLKTLREMGPSAADQIAGLNTLTDEQLLEYSNIWKSKSEVARVEATDQLQELRAKTYSQIQQLQVDTDLQLQQINSTWYTKVEELRAQTATQLETYKTEWLSKIAQLRNGTEKEFIALETKMSEIGANTIQGMIEGMKSMEGPLAAQAKAIAESVSKTIKNTLKIKSPSRVTMSDGEFAGEGVIVGLLNKAKGVANAAKTLALTAKDSLNQFLDGFELEEEDSEIHFKAVVDYSALDRRRFDKTLPIGVTPDTSFTRRLAERTQLSKRQNDNRFHREPIKTTPVEPRPVEVNQELHFHSREMTPSEVARKNLQASRQLAMQWG